MRSTLAFVAGMLVGVLLCWASGPASMHLARGWPDVRLAVRLMDAPAARPSASALRRPVTRSVRMASSNVILARETAVSSNATSTQSSAKTPVDNATPAVAATVAAPSDSAQPAAPLPESVQAAQAGQKTSVSAPDISKPLPDIPKPALDISEPRPVSSKADVAVKAKESAASASASKKKAAAETAPEQEYARALKSYQNGRHAQAREQFAVFMQNFPGHKLLPNALYWTGETWYAQARYERAMKFFSQVVQDHPRHAKSADALLKLAYSALRLGQPGQAGDYLQQLEARYPESPASRLGRQARGRIQGCNESKTVAMARG